MKNILVPLDFSETSINAVEQALVIARATKATVHLFHVVKPVKATSFFGKDRNPHFTLEEATEKMSTVKEQFQSSNIPIQTDIQEGKVFDIISEKAENTQSDLICMGTHGISGFEEFWMGSNAYKVISVANCPVLTLRASFKPAEFSRIVLPIDNSKATRQKVPFTVELASIFNASVLVLGLTSDETGDIHRKISSYTNQVADYVSKAGLNCSQDIRVVSNNTKTTIEYAEQNNADLISIMTEQEIDPTNLILGPYAQQMVNHSEIPVLTSRPDEKLMGSIQAGY